MALPNVRPTLREHVVFAHCPSIATSPSAVSTFATVKGKIKRTFAVSNGTTTGTTAVAVTTTGSNSDIGAGGLSIPPGAGALPVEDFPNNAAGNALVNEGDVITFTPSGGTGASITGTFAAVIAEEG
jgi:hypothetical protein